MGAFARAVANAEVPGIVALTASGFLDDPTLSWGFGVSVTVEGPRAGAFGWAGGLGTSWHVDPRRDLVVVVLTQQLFTGPDDVRLHGALVDAAEADLGR